MSQLMVEDLNVTYGGKIAVNGVSLRVDAGEIVTIIGHNGAGKSSLLNALHGHVPCTGDVRYGDRDISQLTPERRLEAGIALVPQGHQVFGDMTVLDNLLTAGMRVGRDTKSDLARVHSLFPILENRAQQQAATLSGGQQQMLAIGMGLIVEPSLLLVDEPSIGLAPSLVQKVMASLTSARDHYGCAVLLVEQNISESFAVADRVYGMQRGSMIAEAPPEEFSEKYDLMEIM